MIRHSLRVLLALTVGGCANMTTIDLTHHLGSKANPVTLVRGDAKQTSTTIARDRSTRSGELVICPGKPPLVYSVHSAAGSTSLGKSPGGLDLSVAGSASEVGAVIAPLAALTLNADNMDAACHDRMNNWINSADYDTVQMRTRNATLAAFAFQAISALGTSGGTSTSIGGDTTPAASLKKDAQDSADSAKKASDDAKTKYEASAKSDGKGGYTCDGAPDAAVCVANKKDADAKIAKSDALAKAAANVGKVTPVSPSTSPNGGSTSKPVTDAQAAAIVQIYEDATSRESEVTALCIKLFTSPEAFPNLLQTTTDQLREGCASALALQAVTNAAKAAVGNAAKGADSSAIRAATAQLTSEFAASLTATPSAGRIYMQIPSEGDRVFARQLQRQLTANGLPVLNGIENTGDKSPDNWDIRYFYEADLSLAQRLADQVNSLTNVKITPRKFQSVTTAQPGTVELWIGKSFIPSR